MIPLPARWRRQPVLAAIKRLVPGSALRAFVAIPQYDGAVVTARRVLNLYLNRWETIRLREATRSYPVKLTIEPTNICNLRCPACFTGAGELGRKTGAMPLELYRRLLAELGDTLFPIEFTNWGEPLLAKDFCAMVREASERGISTITSTNFSIPFDAARAEALVASGLDMLGVSLDGARQETYEKYRVRGDLETVLCNCRLVADAKKRLGAAKPKLVWEFHVFPHNVDDVEAAKAMAAELGMDISVSKGWVIGPEWEPDSDQRFFLSNPEPFPCLFLWH
jgi:MoaA/NifB/PqqE/SkfB family radical SAM enzyme